MGATSAAKGVTQISNNSEMAGPEQMMAIADALAGLIGEQVEEITDLPAVGALLDGAANWPGRTVYVRALKVPYIWDDGWSPLRMPVAFAEKSAPQSFNSGAGTLIQFEQIFTRGFDVTAGVFTVSTTAWYRISGRIGAFSGGGGSDRWFYVTRNSTSASNPFLSANTSVPGAHGLTNISVVRKLNAGDTLRFYALQNSGGGLTLSDAQGSIEMLERV